MNITKKVKEWDNRESVEGNLLIEAVLSSFNERFK